MKIIRLVCHLRLCIFLRETCDHYIIICGFEMALAPYYPLTLVNSVCLGEFAKETIACTAPEVR